MYSSYHIQRRTSLLLVRRLCMLIITMAFLTPIYADKACGNNPQAAELVELIRQHPQQSRKEIDCSSKLSQIAEYKATLLSENNIIMHNIGYQTPNQLLRNKGYLLSNGYPILGNQVEALAAGEKDAKSTLNQLLNSETHRRLLLGEAPFYKPQNEIGVAYLRQSKSPYDYYWVIYIADTNNRPKPDVEYFVNSEFNYTQPEQKISIRDRHYQSRTTRPKISTDY